MACALLPVRDLLAKAVARLPQRALLGLGRALAWLAWPLLRSRRRVACVSPGSRPGRAAGWPTPAW